MVLKFRNLVSLVCGCQVLAMGVFKTFDRQEISIQVLVCSCVVLEDLW